MSNFSDPTHPKASDDNSAGYANKACLIDPDGSLGDDTEAAPPPARRARRTWIRPLLAALAMLVSLVGWAQPAEAAVPGYLNPGLKSEYNVPGTNCTGITSMWLNSYHYPGAGAYTHCSSAHQVYIAVEADWAPKSGGSWNRWGQTSATYAGSGSISSTVNQTWTVLGGARQWRGVSYVWVDGVYRGSFASRSGVWTAGT